MQPSTQASLDTTAEYKVSLATVIPNHVDDVVSGPCSPSGASSIGAFLAAVRTRVDARLREALDE